MDYVPSPNNTYRLINVRNGNYVEIVDINSGKSNVTFRGQSRSGVVVGYANNAVIDITSTIEAGRYEAELLPAVTG